MIPKIIHYCWFGGEKPTDVLVYIDGWKKLCPDYEIVEWNEQNFDIMQYSFSRDAYKEKKWAFVSDFVRFVVLEKYGGVYLDTDVELIKNLDFLAEESAYVGFEVHGVAAGIIGCEPHNPIISSIAETYKNTSFYVDSGLNLLTSPDYINNAIEPIGFKRFNEKQVLKGITVYPSDWFYPYNLETFRVFTTENTVAIHHYAGSWLDEKSKCQLEIQRKLKWMPHKRVAIWISVALAELKVNGIKGLYRAIREKKW